MNFAYYKVILTSETDCCFFLICVRDCSTCTAVPKRSEGMSRARRRSAKARPERSEGNAIKITNRYSMYFLAVSRLAARFWDLNRGKISVGGMDISKIDPETLLGMYSIVFQDVTLFNNTVMENIRGQNSSFC